MKSTIPPNSGCTANYHKAHVMISAWTSSCIGVQPTAIVGMPTILELTAMPTMCARGASQYQNISNSAPL